jgi:transcriptional regulator with XRE-family HTH domain
MPEPASEAASILGRRLRDARRKLGFSQDQIANLAWMNPSNYGKIERGQGNPEFHTLVRLASVLSVDPGTLIAGIGREALPNTRRPLTVREFVRAERASGS